MRDKNGNQLKAGDKVFVPCTIKETITVETDERMVSGEDRHLARTLTFDAGMVILASDFVALEHLHQQADETVFLKKNEDNTISEVEQPKNEDKRVEPLRQHPCRG